MKMRLERKVNHTFTKRRAKSSFQGCAILKAEFVHVDNGIYVVGISMSKIPIYNRSRTQTSIAIDNNSIVVGESRAHY